MCDSRGSGCVSKPQPLQRLGHAGRKGQRRLSWIVATLPLTVRWPAAITMQQIDVYLPVRPDLFVAQGDLLMNMPLMCAMMRSQGIPTA
jgi:hypothetical protein